METSARLALPLLAPGQVQKEATHNEALTLIDLILAGAVEEAPRVTPPGSPTAGQCYIVAAGATGAWAGQDGALAGYTAGGWRFAAPVEGMRLLVKASGVEVSYVSGAWSLGIIRAAELRVGADKVVGARAAAIASPAGGSTVDSEARTAIAAMLGALRGHGLIET